MTLHVLCTGQSPPYYRVRKDDCVPLTIGYTWLDQNQLGTPRLRPSTAMIQNTCLGDDIAMMLADRGGSPCPAGVDIRLAECSKFQEIRCVEVPTPALN